MKYHIREDGLKRASHAPNNIFSVIVDGETCIKIVRDINPEVAREVFGVKLTKEEKKRIEDNRIKVGFLK